MVIDYISIQRREYIFGGEQFTLWKDNNLWWSNGESFYTFNKYSKLMVVPKAFKNVEGIEVCSTPVIITM